MKKPIFFLLLPLGYLLLFSCHKSNSATTTIQTTGTAPVDSVGFVPADSVIGKWGLAEDTLSVSNSYYYGEGGDAYFPSAYNYIGQTGDSINFETGGTYTINQDSVSSGGTYQFSTNRGISLTSRPPLLSAKIIYLTGDSLVISGSATSANGGSAAEILYLRR